MNKIKKLWTRK